MAAGPEHAGDMRRQGLPRFSGENLAKNLELVERLRAIAAARGATPAQLAIAWACNKGADIVPLVGMRTRRHLDDALAAMQIALSPDELRALEEAVPWRAVAGERYAAQQMRHLDSERAGKS
jgi:aryl-alcohol dehydrogenase-like predicted oxidoreductase